MRDRGTLAYGGDPSVLLARERSLTDVRYETNNFGDKCITVWTRDPKGRPLKVAAATVRFVDFLLCRPDIELPKGLREIVEIRRSHAVEVSSA